MSNSDVKRQWAVQLEGNDQAIGLLEFLLNNSSKCIDDDLAIIRLHQMPVLRQLSIVSSTDPRAALKPQPQELFDNIPALSNPQWNGLTSPEEVLGAASSQLKLIAGALSRLAGSVSINLGTIYEFKPEGRYQVSRISEIPWEVRPGTHPTPDEFRRLIDVADADEWVGNLLMQMAELPDWYAIYKMIEAIEGHCGGSEKLMLSCAYLEGPELKRAKRTANAARHLDQLHHKPPKDPIPLGEARALLNRSITKIVENS